MAETPKTYEGPLKWIKWHGKKVPYNAALGVTLKWINHIKGRITQRLSTKIIVVGEAGISKTYTAIAIAMFFDKRFNIKQVIFGHKDYMQLTLDMPAKRWIVLDEPSYVLGKRDWYNELNKILVQAIESDRYKIHPLIIPIISKDLLDKTVREHLIQFLIIMTDLGMGRVYKLRRDHFNDKVLYRYVCTIRVIMPKRQLATCNRDSCLGCRDLNRDCNKFIWPIYERKRNEIQTKRYKSGIIEIKRKETRKLTFRHKIKITMEEKEKHVDKDGKWDITKIMLRWSCSQAAAYRLKNALELHEQEPIDFETA